LSYGSEKVEAAPVLARPLDWAWRRWSRRQGRPQSRARKGVRRRCRRHAFQFHCHTPFLVELLAPSLLWSIYHRPNLKASHFWGKSEKYLK